ncbi:hypothetical protein Pelo_2984 [Pelomyxa schiedti]|nr:hypothetical protein Pelo_2984 [Pelomyxa schiedti]
MLTVVFGVLLLLASMSCNVLLNLSPYHLFGCTLNLCGVQLGSSIRYYCCCSFLASGPSRGEHSTDSKVDFSRTWPLITGMMEPQLNNIKVWMA